MSKDIEADDYVRVVRRIHKAYLSRLTDVDDIREAALLHKEIQRQFKLTAVRLYQEYRGEWSLQRFADVLGMTKQGFALWVKEQQLKDERTAS